MPNGQIAGFIWSVADLLRGDYKQSEYGRVILPLTVLRRLDCVLEPTKDAVLARAKELKGKVQNVGPILSSRTPWGLRRRPTSRRRSSRWTDMRSAAFTLTRRVIPSTP